MHFKLSNILCKTFCKCLHAFHNSKNYLRQSTFLKEMDCDMTEVAVAVAETTPRQDIDYHALVQQATSDNPEMQSQAVKEIDRLLVLGQRSDNLLQRTATATAMVNSGVLPILVHCLTNNANPDLQNDAVGAIFVITYGPSTNTDAVLHAGAVPGLISLLSSPLYNLRGQALCALGNIAVGATDGPATRNYFISMGIAQPLLHLILAQTDTPTILITRVIKLLCRESFGVQTSPQQETFYQEILPAVIMLVSHPCIEVLQGTLWALQGITNARNERTKIFQTIFDGGVLPSLVTFLSHKNINVRSAALRVIGNLLGTSEQTQAVLECGVLQYFGNLLTQQTGIIRSNTAWVLSNIAAGTLTQVQEVINSQLIPLVINKLDRDERFSTEFAWIVRNIVNHVGNEEQVSYLIGIRVLLPLCKLLSTKSEVLKVVVNDAVRTLLFKIRAEDVEQARSQIAESIGSDRVDEFLQSIQCQGVPQNLQPIRRGLQEADTGGAGDVDDVLQNFQQMKLNF